MHNVYVCIEQRYDDFYVMAVCVNRDDAKDWQARNPDHKNYVRLVEVAPLIDQSDSEQAGPNQKPHDDN